ncbi:LysR family transcriptional regulator [Pelobium sp.]|nr:LysR family transcriptional regulator [Pelobium sp.]MDA9555740.1 LysR family transcriptional regulator [Pelobium sp.]
MNYTLHQLQVFLKIVETKSITKASKELFLTQPAVSIQLKNFQDQFEIPLIEIIGKQVQITDFGLEIAKMAEVIVNEMYAINYKTLAFKGILSGRLKIAIVSTGKYIMPFFLVDYLRKNEGIDLTMDVTNKTKVLESLEKGEVDFALVSLLPKTMKVEEEVLLNNELYFIGNLEKSFDSKVYSKSIFNELPIIYRETGSGTRVVMENFFEQSKVTVKKKLELTSNEAVKQAIIAGLGYSIMPLIGIHQELIDQKLQIIPVQGLPVTSKWRLIWLKNKKLSPVAEDYLNYLRLNKKDLVFKNFDWINEFESLAIVLFYLYVINEICF